MGLLVLTVQEIQKFIDNDNTSDKKRKAKIGHHYYEAEHDIRNYKIYYVDAKGALVEDKNRSNIKISHPFFSEIVDQTVQYLLSGKDSIITVKNPDDTALQEALDAYFGDDFRAELISVAADCCIGGFAYMYCFKGSDFKTRFTYADALGVVEVRETDTDDNTAYVIYYYTDFIDKGKSKIIRIQVWDEKETWYYVQPKDGKIELDKDAKINPRPHIVYSKDDEDDKFGGAFGFIPFFRLDNNRKQTSHLKPIKALIDDYDIMSCGLSNNLQDITEGLYVVKGFQGDDMEELIRNIKVKKHVGIDPDGDVDIRTINIPYEARKIKLELDEKNIYRFGMAFNAAQVGDGNITNIVIKSRYALLDLKCDKLEIRLKQFLKKLIAVALAEINETLHSSYAMKDISIEFKRQIMTNAIDNEQIEKFKAETQQIKLNSILNSAAKLDDETVLQSICDLFDLDYDEIKGKVPKATDFNLASE
ncbi:MAG: phage portal protein, partial [Oscillospiraceae bacterium]